MSGLHQTGFIWLSPCLSLAAGISPHPVESDYLQKWLCRQVSALTKLANPVQDSTIRYSLGYGCLSEFGFGVKRLMSVSDTFYQEREADS
jgi:hypothetical protein